MNDSDGAHLSTYLFFFDARTFSASRDSDDILKLSSLLCHSILLLTRSLLLLRSIVSAGGWSKSYFILRYVAGGIFAVKVTVKILPIDVEIAVPKFIHCHVTPPILIK